VEAVEYFLLSFPASFFKVLPLSQKFNRFRIPAPCFTKNASASGSSKSQMFPSSLPASFFKVLLFPQKLNRFHIPASHSLGRHSFANKQT